jgi:hypothetical protein
MLWHMAKSTFSSQRLRANINNPRKIKTTKSNMLADSLARYGDLGGVIFNRRTGQLVGGHQRVAAFTARQAQDVVLERTYEAPTSTGTVAEGAFVIEGERFSYREVDWDEHTEMAANIAANSGAGQWQFDKLTEIFNELDANNFDLDLTMWDGEDRDKLLGGAEDVKQEDVDLTFEAEYKILVTCRDDAHQTELLERFNDEGVVCKALVS